MIEKVLFITLSNIGDVILTLPALDYLRAAIPAAEITVFLARRPSEIFENNPQINKVIVYDKKSSLRQKLELFLALKKEKYDLVVDLRNSLFGLFLPAKYKTSCFLIAPGDIRQMKDRHLYKIKYQISNIKNKEFTGPVEKTLYIGPHHEQYIDDILGKYGVSKEDRIVVVAAGARSHIKRWPKEKFTELIDRIVKELAAKVVLVGDKDDLPITKYILEHIQVPVLDLSAKTDLLQLAALLEKAGLVITCDSACLHLASYLNKPVVAIFGPTDDTKYGPWSQNCAVVKREVFCRPCQQALCRFRTVECMSLVRVEDVFKRIKEVSEKPPKTISETSDYTDYLRLQRFHSSRLNLRNLFLNHCNQRALYVFGLFQSSLKKLLPCSGQQPAAGEKNNFKRILIVRTDRVGDVVLSTPVIKALRQEFPNAYISMMVRPYSREVVEGNPELDEVIIYDKYGRHKGWHSSFMFAMSLKKKRFDLAIVLHPANRVHILTYLAGIPRRIGYDRKFAFLLTDRIKHTKQLGQKHELEYTLDLIRYLGIEPQEKALSLPISKESERWVEELFVLEGIKKFDKLLAINPGASCPSKIWPQERFAQAADKLAEKYGFKVFIISGPDDLAIAEKVAKKISHPVINMAGKTSIRQLISLLKRCSLFISNDSGPVHIASAVGTPVISIFGRSQEGLSPKRWGAVGIKDRNLHKNVGCIKCLAHNCVNDFTCLKAITIDDVVKAADDILNESSTKSPKTYRAL